MHMVHCQTNKSHITQVYKQDEKKNLSHIPCGCHKVNDNKSKCKSYREIESGCDTTRFLHYYECTSSFPEHIQTLTDLVCPVHIKNCINK